MADLSCSFCGKARPEVAVLVEGPSVYICDECIGLCIGIAVEREPNILGSLLSYAGIVDALQDRSRGTLDA